MALPGSASAFVYWANQNSDAIGRASLDGSSPNQGFIVGASRPCGVAVDGAHLYWANQDSGTIGRANLDGSDPNQSFIAGAIGPCGVAVDGTYIYWANEFSSKNTIGRANLDGSGADQSFIAAAFQPCGVAVDGAHVYWANFNPFGPASIGRARLDGSRVRQKFITTESPCGVVSDAAHVYWASEGFDTIGRANLDGSSPNQALIAGANVPCGVAVDAAHVYWANEGVLNSIGRANLDGSSPNESFISGTSFACGVAVDADHWRLAVAPAGSGSGTVTGAGIDCPGTCSEVLGGGTTVTLDATPVPGSTFAGWSGACSGTGPCTLTMDSDKAVTATFTAQRTLAVSTTGPGSGHVSGPGIACGLDCSEAYTDGTDVVLSAIPGARSRFTGWSGTCSGKGACSLAMDADRSAAAAFKFKPPDTEITEAKIRPKKRKARFMFEAKGKGRHKGFQCRLKRTDHEAKPFNECRSPTKYTHLKHGKYTFKVRAKGPGGHDSTPAKKRFKIKK